MAYIRLPLGIRVAVEFDLNGKVVVNIYHVTTADPITTVKLEAIAQVFIDWWTTIQLDNVSDEVALIGVTAMNLDVPNGEKIELPVVPAVYGTVVGGSVPNNVALVIGLRTAQTGRSFQGRTYIAGLGDQEVTQNTISTARLGTFIIAFATLDVDLLAINSQLVVASFVSGGVPRAEGIATQVDAISGNTRVDTQRRRLPES